jgi:cytochrome c peroxidase
MNNKEILSSEGIEGFNLFMSKAQCATCHFVPQFNGVKPPYVGSEFEVLGVPADSNYSRINADEGRFGINPANETMHAFRTGTLRNADHTMPYMHNGVFQTMRQVIDFYDGGGGAGRGLNVPNQTLSSDSLKLSEAEKNDLMLFISSLNENIKFEPIPTQLPVSADSHLNKRKVGGEY